MGAGVKREPLSPEAVASLVDAYLQMADEVREIGESPMVIVVRPRVRRFEATVDIGSDVPGGGAI